MPRIKKQKTFTNPTKHLMRQYYPPQYLFPSRDTRDRSRVSWPCTRCSTERQRVDSSPPAHSRTIPSPLLLPRLSFSRLIRDLCSSPRRATPTWRRGETRSCTPP